MKDAKRNGRDLARGVSTQSGHAVEIGVVTGEVCEPLLAHDSNHQRHRR